MAVRSKIIMPEEVKDNLKIISSLSKSINLIMVSEDQGSVVITLYPHPNDENIKDYFDQLSEVNMMQQAEEEAAKKWQPASRVMDDDEGGLDEVSI